MVQQITDGIQVSVETSYDGCFQRGYQIHYSFSYTIRIHNQRKSTVKLYSRFWKIHDALNDTEIVIGEGVIGEQPILQPGEAHTYSSGCVLLAPLGSMKGHYRMRELIESEEIKVGIPTFQLHAGFAMN